MHSNTVCFLLTTKLGGLDENFYFRLFSERVVDSSLHEYRIFSFPALYTLSLHALEKIGIG